MVEKVTVGVSWTKKLVVFNLPPGFALNMHTADSAPTQADTERTLRVVD